MECNRSVVVTFLVDIYKKKEFENLQHRKPHEVHKMELSVVQLIPTIYNHRKIFSHAVFLTLYRVHGLNASFEGIYYIPVY